MIDQNVDSRLVVKPTENGTIFSRLVPGLSVTVALRSLDLATDIAEVHRWAHHAYAKKFWQLEGSVEFFRRTYGAVLANPYTHVFVALIGDRPCGLIEVYALHADETLLRCLPCADPADAGIHLLMCPPRELRKGWSRAVLTTFVQHYFSFQENKVLYAEPDRHNHLANKLALDAGFRYVKTIDMPHKTANVYSIGKPVNPH